MISRNHTSNLLNNGNIKKTLFMGRMVLAFGEANNSD